MILLIEIYKQIKIPKTKMDYFKISKMCLIIF